MLLRNLLSISALAFITQLAGCSSNREPIRIVDDWTTIPTYSVGLSKKKDAHDNSSEFVYSYSAAQGDASQQLGSGQYVQVGSGVITGPASINYDYFFKKQTLAYRANTMLSSKCAGSCSFEYTLGLGQTDYRVASLPPHATAVPARASNIGLLVGVGFGVWFSDTLAARLRYEAIWSDIESQETTLLLEYALSNQLSASAGLRRWAIRDGDDYNANMKATLKGAVFGLQYLY